MWLILLKCMGEKIKKNQNDESLPNNQPMKYAITTELEMSDSARILPLVPQEINGEFEVQAKEAMMEKDGDISVLRIPVTMMTSGKSNIVLLQKEKST
ncbi:hypothetical protein V5N11_032668 [Cardamine amara subsp. amara]|uniref:Uncharacterized protein n=1 Tax=Cardamine amara subsp. amara TaxID=228776 RepID=A0ABD1AWT1_CARAN